MRAETAMPDPVSVRPAVAADAPVLTELMAALNRHQRDPVEHMTLERVRADALGDDPWFETLIAERDGAVVGYVCFHRAYETAFAARGFYVQDLYVTEEARGGGVGKALVAAVAALARERGAIYLWWVSKLWNVEAQAAYAQWGAIEEQVKAHALFGEPFDALVRGGERPDDR